MIDIEKIDEMVGYARAYEAATTQKQTELAALEFYQAWVNAQPALRALRDEVVRLREVAKFFDDCLWMRATGTSAKKTDEFRKRWGIPDGVTLDDFSQRLTSAALSSLAGEGGKKC